MNKNPVFEIELCKNALNARITDCCDQCKYGQNIGVIMGVGTCEKYGGLILEITVCDSFERREYEPETAC